MKIPHTPLHTQENPGLGSLLVNSTQLKLIASIANGRYFEAQTLNDLSLALLVITKNESTVQTYHSRTTSVEYYDKLIFISGAFLVLAWILRRLYLKEFI